MLEEDDLPRRPRRLEKLPLDLLGIEELHDYIAELREEIRFAMRSLKFDGFPQIGAA